MMAPRPIRRCYVLSCENNKKDHGVRLYVFPKDLESFNIWKKLIGRPELLLNETYPFLCGLHFKEEEVHSMKCRLTDSLKNKGTCHCQVNKGCVPTLNLPESSSNEIKRLERKQRRSNHKVVQELLLTSSVSETENNAEENYEIVVENQSDEVLQVFSDSESECDKKFDPIIGENSHILDQEPEVFSLHDLCRICAQPAENMVPVFGEAASSNDLLNKINLCLPIKVQEEDKLPANVCQSCLSRIDSSYELIVMCQKAEEILNKMRVQQDMFESCDDLNEMEDMICDDEYQGFEVTDYPAQQMDYPCVSGTDVEYNSPVVSESDTGCFVCNLCFKSFGTENEQSSHMSEGHIFMCVLCNFTVRGVDKSVLENHYTSFHSESTIENNININNVAVDTVKQTSGNTTNCNNNEVIKTFQYLSVHVSVKCKACFRSFKTEKQLESHVCKPKLPPIPKIKCKLCYMSHYKTKTSFKTHLRKHHSLIPCRSPEQCFQYFDTLEEESEHHKNIHKNLRRRSERVLCDTCGKTFSKLGLLRAHIYYIHENKDNLYKCNLCDNTYRYKPKLNEHMLLHSKDRVTLKCKHCDSKFLTKRVINNHIMQSHKEKLFHCECGKIFTTKRSLHTHIENMHIKSWIYHCNICKAQFTMPNEVTDHYNNHTKKEKANNKKNNEFYKTSKYQCKICFEYLKLKSYLGIHIKNKHQLNIKQYSSLDEDSIENLRNKFKYVYHKTTGKIKCPICSKICINLVGYKHHIAIHSKVMKFSCKLCRKPFPTLSQVKAHERLHLSHDNIYYCNDCTQQFTNKKKLVLHFQKVHFLSVC